MMKYSNPKQSGEHHSFLFSFLLFCFVSFMACAGLCCLVVAVIVNFTQTSSLNWENAFISLAIVHSVGAFSWLIIDMGRPAQCGQKRHYVGSANVYMIANWTREETVFLYSLYFNFFCQVPFLFVSWLPSVMKSDQRVRNWHKSFTLESAFCGVILS